MKIRDIIKAVEQMDKPQRITLLMMINQMGVKINEHADGSRIDLVSCTAKQLSCISLFIESLKPLSEDNRI